MRSVKLVLRIAGMGMLALVIAGVVYEKIGEHRDRNRYPQIGRSVDIGGRTLNIYCSGEGGPSVVFEAGGHSSGYTWINIQPETAKLTHACWYDRAGMGWSDPGPSPRTFIAIAKDLHALLHAAAVSPPYVLVAGGGLGDDHVRVFNGLYPTEVAGAVLVGATDPDVETHELKYMKGAMSFLPPWARRVACKAVFPAMRRLGLMRLLGYPGSNHAIVFGAVDAATRRELDFLSITRSEGEACSHEESNAEVRAAGDFGNRPLVILDSSEPERAPSPEYEKAVEAFNDYWFHQLLPRLATLSTRGRLVLVKDPRAPETIIAAVREVVSEVRAPRLESRPSGMSSECEAELTNR
jgi:hypothetical protein